MRPLTLARGIIPGLAVMLMGSLAATSQGMACQDCDFVRGAMCHFSRTSPWKKCKTIGANLCWFQDDCTLSPKGPIVIETMVLSFSGGQVEGFPAVVSAGNAASIRAAVASIAGLSTNDVAVRARMFEVADGDISGLAASGLAGLGDSSILHSVTRDDVQAAARVRVCRFASGEPLVVRADQTIGNGQALLVSLSSSGTRFVLAYQVVISTEEDVHSNELQWQEAFAADVDSLVSGPPLPLSQDYAPSDCNP